MKRQNGKPMGDVGVSYAHATGRYSGSEFKIQGDTDYVKELKSKIEVRETAGFEANAR